MELNHTTENLNFTIEHGGESRANIKTNKLSTFKIIKNKNNFFTSYQPIEIRTGTTVIHMYLHTQNPKKQKKYIEIKLD